MPPKGKKKDPSAEEIKLTSPQEGERLEALRLKQEKLKAEEEAAIALEAEAAEANRAPQNAQEKIMDVLKRAREKKAKKKKRNQSSPSQKSTSPKVQEALQRISEHKVERDRLREINEAAEARRAEEAGAELQYQMEMRSRILSDRKEQRALEAAERIQTMEQRREERIAILFEQREIEKQLRLARPLHIQLAERDEELKQQESLRRKEVIMERHEMFQLPMIPLTGFVSSGAFHANALQEFKERKQRNEEERKAPRLRVEKREGFSKVIRDKLPPITRSKSVPLPLEPDPIPKKGHKSLGNDYMRAVLLLPKRRHKKIEVDDSLEPDPSHLKARRLGNEYLKVAKRLGSPPRLSGEVPSKAEPEVKKKKNGNKRPVDVDDYIDAVKAKMDLLQKLSK